jgi:phenylalanyl-tRNA synthetase beta chain
MRRSLLASVMDDLEHNDRLAERLAFFEIGPVFIPDENHGLPEEPQRLAIAMRGPRELPSWDKGSPVEELDFFDLKGVIESLLGELHIPDVNYAPAEDKRFHPGKSAQVCSGETVLGVFGELHPLVKSHYDLDDAPVQAAALDLECIEALIPERWDLRPVAVFPPVIEDIAVVVDEGLPAAKVESTIWSAGGKLLTRVRLFDIFRGGQIGEGKKSMAYNLVYQAEDRTLTDGEVAQIRGRIVRRLEQDLGAKLRTAG